MAGVRWTEKEELVLKRLYADCSNKMIAEQLGRTPNAVSNHAKSLGLSKSQGYFRRLAIESDLANHGGATRFKPGHKTHNKGKNFNPGGNSRLTQFKPGNKPANLVPLGYKSVRVTKGKPYIYIKTEEGMRPLHRVIAEQHYGNLKPGTIVRFKDGNYQNCAIENLELTNQENNMRLNSIVRYPSWLRNLMRLQSKLNSTINNHGKEQN